MVYCIFCDNEWVKSNEYLVGISNQLRPSKSYNFLCKADRQENFCSLKKGWA